MRSMAFSSNGLSTIPVQVPAHAHLLSPHVTVNDGSATSRLLAVEHGLVGQVVEADATGSETASEFSLPTSVALAAAFN